MDGKEVVWVNAQSVISPARFYLAFPLAFFPCLWGKAFKSGQNMRGYNERRERKRENGFGVGLCRRRRRCANSNFDSEKALKDNLGLHCTSDKV